jgi:hypothetical protein
MKAKPIPGLPLPSWREFLGRPPKLRKFESALNRLKIKYGFLVFHTIEFKGRSGEFAVWSPTKYLALITELSDLTPNGLTHGAILSVRNAE